jgi:cytidyltransferase-like protein
MKSKKSTNTVSVKDLPSVRKKHRNKKIVFCSGVFDLTHAGHALFFEDCKKFGDILVVSVAPDALVRNYKKGRPVLNEQVRLKMVSALKPVDYTFLHPITPFKTNEEMNDSFHLIFPKLQPDVYVINNDANGLAHRKELVKGYPYITLRVLKRTAPKTFEGISTTGIIEKIQRLPK